MDWLRYLITRFEPTDVPQVQMLGFMQSMFAEEILKSPMVKTTAISDAGLTKRTLYELDRSNFTRETYDRAIECMDAVNFEIQGLIHRAWGGSNDVDRRQNYKILQPKQTDNEASRIAIWLGKTHSRM